MSVPRKILKRPTETSEKDESVTSILDKVPIPPWYWRCTGVHSDKDGKQVFDYECSACRHPMTGDVLTNYCPNCGTIMNTASAKNLEITTSVEEKLPDLVRVVRCSECMHSRELSEIEREHFAIGCLICKHPSGCGIPHPEYNRKDKAVFKDDYCRYGVKRIDRDISSKVIRQYLENCIQEWNNLGDRKYEVANMQVYNHVRKCLDDLEGWLCHNAE